MMRTPSKQGREGSTATSSNPSPMHPQEDSMPSRTGSGCGVQWRGIQAIRSQEDNISSHASNADDSLNGNNLKGRKAGRPRSHSTDSAILKATIELLCESGFSDLTMEAIATRAGVAKTTVYRRWPSKVPLVIDAVSQTITADLPVPNTGSLSKDIRAMLHEFVEVTNRPSGRAILKLLAEGRSDPDLKEALRLRFLDQRTTNLMMMLKRGLARGEVRADVDMELAIDMGVATVIHRLLFMEEPLDHKAADHLANLLISAVSVR